MPLQAPIRNLSYTYTRTENHVCTLRCQSQKVYSCIKIDHTYMSDWWTAGDEGETMLVSGTTLTQSSSGQYTSVWSSVGRYICTKPSQHALVRRTPEQLIPLHGYSLTYFLLRHSNGLPYTHSARKDEVLQRRFDNKRS